MPTASLEAIVFRDEPGWANYSTHCVGWWDDPRIEGHAIIRVEQPIIYPEIPILVAIPFNRGEAIRDVYGKDSKGRDLEHLSWSWNGVRPTPNIGVISMDPKLDLRPSFVWPRDPTPEWPTLHVFIQNGKLVDAGSQMKVVS